MLIETHAHLDYPDFADDFEGVLARAAEAGVTRIISIGTSLESSRRAVALAEKHPQVFAAVGVHPCSADEAGSDFVSELRELARNPRVVAIGETGFDYHRLPSQTGPALIGHQDDTSAECPGDFAGAVRDGAYKATQASVFEQHLDLAVELGLGVIIHERDAWEDTVALLRPYTGRLRAVFHCFGKSIEQAQELIALGHLVSFTGIVTFKNARSVQECAAEVPAGSFMVETDCPYLAPVPHRGKRCEPAHVHLVAEKIATLRNQPLTEIAAQTTATAEAFFRFPR